MVALNNIKDNRKAYFLAALAILFWSTAATAFKLALSQLHLIPVLAIATLTSLFLLFVFILFSNKLALLKDLTIKDYYYSALLGLLNPFVYYLVLFKAYSLLPAQVAQPLNFIWPIVLVIFTAMLFRRKLSVISIAALFISFTGVYFISSEGKLFDFEFSSPAGIALALGSSVFWALYWVLNLKDKKDTLIKLFMNFLFASVYLLVLIMLTRPYDLNPEGVFYSMYIGCFEMGFTFIIWLKALEMIDKSEKISNLIYLTPFFSLVFIHLILEEQIYVTTFIGLVIIIGSIIFQQKLENH